MDNRRLAAHTDVAGKGARKHHGEDGSVAVTRIVV